MRHTAVRIAFVQGASIQAIVGRLGHPDAATALEVWPLLLDPEDGDEHDGGESE
jgi:hypothetical protein